MLWLCISENFIAKGIRQNKNTQSFNNDWWVWINNSHKKFLFLFSSIFSSGCRNILFILDYHSRRQKHAEQSKSNILDMLPSPRKLYHNSPYENSPKQTQKSNRNFFYVALDLWFNCVSISNLVFCSSDEFDLLNIYIIRSNSVTMLKLMSPETLIAKNLYLSNVIV